MDDMRIAIVGSRSNRWKEKSVAADQHNAALDLLTNIRQWDQLLSLFPPSSTDLIILRKLRNACAPVSGSALEEESGVNKSAISHATTRLNKQLLYFSKNVRLLKDNHLRIEIPRKDKNSSRIGYYLSILDTQANTYLPSSRVAKLVSLQGLVLLQSSDNVLRINCPPDPDWFRSPVASDIADNRVYRFKVIDDLKQKLSEKSALLIEGEPATGKTVIVRYLMYELWKEGHSDVYYLDIAQARHFREEDLTKEVMNVTGLIIIENTHLRPHAIYRLIDRFRDSPGRQFLCTTRPQQIRYTNDGTLVRPSVFTLEPFSEIEDLIAFLCLHPNMPQGINMKRHRLVRTCDGDYWLLTRALLGCAKRNGIGDPTSWISDAVKHKLTSYEVYDETEPDDYFLEFPKLLVALSPLYQFEIPTAEGFLINRLNIRKPVLAALLKRGEITQEGDLLGNRFYGLPHSSLAKAYWNNGRKYVEQSELRTSEDFIYHYVVSSMPNAMEALVQAEERIQNTVFSRLNQNSTIIDVIRNESSLTFISEWAKNPIREPQLTSELTDILVDKITQSNEIAYIFETITGIWDRDASTGLELWNRLNTVNLANNLFHAQGMDLPHICGFLISLTNNNRDIAKDFTKQLDLTQLTCLLQNEPEITSVCFCIYSICYANSTKSEQLLIKLKKYIRDRLNETGDMGALSFSLGQLMWCHRIINKADLGFLDISMVDRSLEPAIRNDIVHDIVASLSPDRLSELSRNPNQFDQMVHVLDCINRINPKTCKKFLNAISWSQIFDELNESPDFYQTVSSIRRIHSIDTKLSKELMCKMRLDYLAEELNAANNVELISRIMVAFCAVCPGEIDNLCDRIKADDLAEKYTHTCDTRGTFVSISTICEHIPWYGKKLCQALDVKDFAEQVNSLELNKHGKSELFDCLSAICQIEKKVAKQLASNVNMDLLRQQFRTVVDLKTNSKGHYIIGDRFIRVSSELLEFLNFRVIDGNDTIN